MTDITLVELDECDSTQDEVRDRLADREAGASVAVVTRSQRAGRGREGRTWHDPPGRALLLSVGRRGPISVDVLDDLPRRVARIVEELAAMRGGQLQWRAPNDLLAPNGAKVAGVLIDARTLGRVVEVVSIGIGINVDATPFTTVDGRRATSLREAGADVTDVAGLRDDLVDHFARLLE